MFAGPNGSGKSSAKSVLRPELLGVYVNADEVAEVTAGRLIEWKWDEVPIWFQVHVLDKF